VLQNKPNRKNAAADSTVVPPKAVPSCHWQFGVQQAAMRCTVSPFQANEEERQYKQVIQQPSTTPSAAAAAEVWRQHNSSIKKLLSQRTATAIRKMVH